MVDFVKMQGVARTLIEANGRSVTLISDPTAAANPSEPERGPDFSTGATEVAVIMSFVPAAGSGFGKNVRRTKGAELLHGFDQMALLAATSFNEQTALAIEDFDRVRDGSTMYTIGMVEILRPADEEIIYQLGLKK